MLKKLVAFIFGVFGLGLFFDFAKLARPVKYMDSSMGIPNHYTHPRNVVEQKQESSINEILSSSNELISMADNAKTYNEIEEKLENNAQEDLSEYKQWILDQIERDLKMDEHLRGKTDVTK